MGTISIRNNKNETSIHSILFNWFDRDWATMMESKILEKNEIKKLNQNVLDS